MGVQCIEIHGRLSLAYSFVQIYVKGGFKWEFSALRSMGGEVKISVLLRVRIFVFG